MRRVSSLSRNLTEGESYADLDKTAHAILDTLGLNQNEETAYRIWYDRK